MHIAVIGQSVHGAFFCSSGQHAMSAAIDDISVIDVSLMPDISCIPAGIDADRLDVCACVAAGAVTGATASPATIAIASKRDMIRRNTMAYSRTAAGPYGRDPASLSRQGR